MDIGTQLAQLERRLRAVERSSRLSSASLDDTALEVRDGTGSLKAIVGQQSDGTTAVNVVNGGPPPTPSDPVLSSSLGGIGVLWDGNLAGGGVQPLDWSRVEIHASPIAAFTPLPATLQGTIESPQGGGLYIPTTGPLYVRLLSRTTSGAASDPTTTIGPVGPRPVEGDIPVGGITATLIADGAVTTPKIFANAVTTATLAAGAVDATALKADAITGKTITGGTITGTDITGATVTGSTVRTGTSGERVVLTPTPPAPIAQRPSILLYSSVAGEILPGIINTGEDPAVTGRPLTVIGSPYISRDSANRPLQSLLQLGAPKVGTAGGQFYLVATGPFTSTDLGTAYVRGTSAATTAGTSEILIRAIDGSASPKSSQVTVTGTTATVTTDGVSHGFDATGLDVTGAIAATGALSGASLTTTGNAGISGRLSAGNIASGSVTITSGSSIPASGTVSGLSVAGSTFHAFVTVNTAAPGTAVLGASVDNVTGSGMTIWFTRSGTATANTIHWLLIGE